MKILIAIPSIGRLEKLERCINSIVKCRDKCQEHTVELAVFFNRQSEADYLTEKYKGLPWITAHMINGEHRSPSLWNFILQKFECDCLCYLSDDLELDYNCIHNGLQCMLKNFPDLDGVVGFFIKNFPPDRVVQASFGLIGKKFADRFPDRKVFCPDYYKFWIDKELEDYATSIGKFIYCAGASLIHYHPAHSKEDADQTHRDVRNYIMRDITTRNERQKRNYLWGKDFMTIGA